MENPLNPLVDVRVNNSWMSQEKRRQITQKWTYTFHYVPKMLETHTPGKEKYNMHNNWHEILWKQDSIGFHRNFAISGSYGYLARLGGIKTVNLLVPDALTKWRFIYLQFKMCCAVHQQSLSAQKLQIVGDEISCELITYLWNVSSTLQDQNSKVLKRMFQGNISNSNIDRSFLRFLEFEFESPWTFELRLNSLMKDRGKWTCTSEKRLCEDQ